MREGLDAPTLQLPADDVEEIRAFLDGQSRITLAGWVRHEQHGPEGALYDHHLMLGVDDRDWETGDLRALDEGMRSVRDIAPDVTRVTARRTRLWKGESKIEDDTILCIVWDFEHGPPPGPLRSVLDAARAAGIEHNGGELRRPQDAESDFETGLYDAGEAR